MMSLGDFSSRSYRIITAGTGALFAGIAVVIAVMSDHSIGPILAALVLGGLGLEAVYSAWRCRLSLLGRIGPLP